MRSSLMRFFSNSLSDAELIDGLRIGGINRRLFENSLYDQYAYLIREGVRRHRLDEEETATAYADTVLSVIDQIVTGRFEGRAGLKTYLTQIFSNKCVDGIRKKSTNKESVHRQGVEIDGSLLQVPDETGSAIQQLIAQHDAQQLRERMKLLGDKCRAMLLAWAEGFTDDDIAREHHYNSAAVAKTSRLRCLEKLRDLYRT
ncbi:MAG: sigma-70 family RNA polymerase sigma factor [Rudanella sp.]|nr:sigma-70 family RNA polymerase sigma factor [Rudanella sp.]